MDLLVAVQKNFALDRSWLLALLCAWVCFAESSSILILWLAAYLSSHPLEK